MFTDRKEVGGPGDFDQMSNEELGEFMLKTSTRDLEAGPLEEWRREMDQTLFPGGYFKEFIFFHKASKTLILADTIVNIEPDKVTEPRRTAIKFTGIYHPYGQIFFGMRLPILLHRQKTKAAIGKIQS